MPAYIYQGTRRRVTAAVGRRGDGLVGRSSEGQADEDPHYSQRGAPQPAPDALAPGEEVLRGEFLPLPAAGSWGFHGHGWSSRPLRLESSADMVLIRRE